MQDQRKTSVTYQAIHPELAGQRIDHFLFCLFKKVPKDLIYRLIRTGQIRINKRRTKLNYRLATGDTLRIPPLDIKETLQPFIPPKEFRILYEDEALVVIDKPANIASHGGSGISFGVIEQFKKARPDARYLRLVHRLDKETSGLLILAKKHSAIVHLHETFRQGNAEKHYYALALGNLTKDREEVKMPLQIQRMSDGTKYVEVNQAGYFSHTIFTVIKRFRDFTLVDAQIKTGRTHQIRAHLKYLGHPIAGDKLYGDFAYNKILLTLGLKRMFLHAYRITLPHPIKKKLLTVESSLAKDLQKILEQLNRS
jgi:23S rRNA pseudouridine955/2504/2580 synthase